MSTTPPRPGLRERLRATWQRLMTIEDTPHNIAMGVFIGVMVAYQPIVGLQMIVGAIICKVIGANVIASLPMAWITNPVTIVPIFYGTYKLGEVFTGGQLSYEELERRFATIADIDGIFNAFVEGTRLLWDIMWPMVLGGLLVGVVNGLLFYYLVRRFVTAYQSRRILTPPARDASVED